MEGIKKINLFEGEDGSRVRREKSRGKEVVNNQDHLTDIEYKELQDTINKIEIGKLHKMIILKQK